MPDQSTIQPPPSNEPVETTTTTLRPIGSGAYKSLNVTSHTIASNYNNASVVTSATAFTVTVTNGGGATGWTRRLNPNQVEMCKKLKLNQIEMVGGEEEETGVIMSGAYSRIQEARLMIEITNDDDDENQYDENVSMTAKSVATTATTTTTTTKSTSRVMVKICTGSKDQVQRMLIESAMLRGLKHKNICAVMGICLPIDEEHPAMSVFPYFEMGNLKTFLSEVRVRNLKKSSEQRTSEQHKLDEDVRI